MIKQTPTSELLFLSFYELCHSMPIEKITIDDIVKNCGMKRGIFYYYYKDKNDLINSNIYRIIYSIHKENYGILKWEDIIELNCKSLLDYRDMHDYMMNHFDMNYKIDTDSFYKYIYEIVKTYYGTVDHQMENIITFYCGGSVGLINQWIMSGYKQSPKQLAHNLVEAIHPRLLKALNKE